MVDLPKGKVIYKAGDAIGYTYFPHNTFVSLVTVLKDGGSVEVAVFGRESALGFVSALISRRSFGQYIVQVAGTASRISIERLHQAIGLRPKVRHLLLRFTEAMLAQSLQIRRLQRGPQRRGALLPVDPEHPRPHGSGYAAPDP